MGILGLILRECHRYWWCFISSGSGCVVTHLNIYTYKLLYFIYNYTVCRCTPYIFHFQINSELAVKGKTKRGESNRNSDLDLFLIYGEELGKNLGRKENVILGFLLLGI